MSCSLELWYLAKAAQGMDLTYTTKAGATKNVRVVFDPPLAGYEEVKPRLMNMKADAEENLGMVRASLLHDPRSSRIARRPKHRKSRPTAFRATPGKPPYSC